MKITPKVQIHIPITIMKKGCRILDIYPNKGVQNVYPIEKIVPKSPACESRRLSPLEEVRIEIETVRKPLSINTSKSHIVRNIKAFLGVTLIHPLMNPIKN